MIKGNDNLVRSMKVRASKSEFSDRLQERETVERFRSFADTDTDTDTDTDMNIKSCVDFCDH